ncbi:MAG: hypothetical protein M0P58_13425, partial [Bacteroidales bacterium]|nr:hypothetical protein [Bacteroidales bacterium]
MKNLLLITVLLCLSFFLPAQTVKTVDHPDKKSILTRNNEGKFSSMTVLGKNAQNEFILNSTPLNRLSDFSYDLKP